MSASHDARARSGLNSRIRFRAFRSADLNALVSVAARGLPADPISADWLAEYVLLEPNFDPDGLIVAADETSDRVLGFCYAVRAGTGAALVAPDGGWITILVVDPDTRRQGIGSGLVTQALDYLRRRGAPWATVAGYPPAYFLPGVDADAYPDGLRVLEALGFETTTALGSSGRASRRPQAASTKPRDSPSPGAFTSCAPHCSRADHRHFPAG